MASKLVSKQAGSKDDRGTCEDMTNVDAVAQTQTGNTRKKRVFVRSSVNE